MKKTKNEALHILFNIRDREAEFKKKLLATKEFTVLDSWFFGHCDRVKEIFVPNSITKIEGHAFFNCAELTHLSLPNTIKQIDENAFAKCNKLDNIIFRGKKEEWLNIIILDKSLINKAIVCDDGIFYYLVG